MGRVGGVGCGGGVGLREAFFNNCQLGIRNPGCIGWGAKILTQPNTGTQPLYFSKYSQTIRA